MTVSNIMERVRRMRAKLQNWTGRVGKLQMKQATRIIRTTRWKLGSWLGRHKWLIAKGAAAAVILAGISAGGNRYIEKHTYEIYHVYLNGQVVGAVNDASIVGKAVQDRFAEIAAAHPDVEMKLIAPDIDFEKEVTFKGEFDNDRVIDAVRQAVTAKAVGVALVINGEEVARLKSREEAEALLDAYKEKFMEPRIIIEDKEVAVLSAEPVLTLPKDEDAVVKSVEFTKSVRLEDVLADPGEFDEPDVVLAMLESTGAPPVVYEVQEGDCVSCIGAKFGYGYEDLPLLYAMNPWIENDRIYPGDKMIIKPFTPDLGVKVVKVAIEEVEIQHDIIYETDDTLRIGKTRVISPGKNGLKKQTYELTYINGFPVSETLIGEEVLVQPVAAVVAKGTLRLAGEGTGKFAWPVKKAKITSKFGKRWGRNHNGIDITSSDRTILAADTGKVVFAGEKNGYGKTVIIDHQNGYETLYAHLSKISVSKGDIVEKGDKIGVMGSTGNSTGVHLHFEVLEKGKVQNPLKYLNQ
jgi:murein DD-endopeptidase MepM/ murein hydrolase activator NlpD